MMFRIVYFLILFFSVLNSKCDNISKAEEEFKVIIELHDSNIVADFDSIIPRTVKFKRGKAVAFTLFTGIFGGHRIYFGTHHRTPIIYSLTFGGLGILPIIDLIHIIFTKDLARYEHKSQIIMWGK